MRPGERVQAEQRATKALLDLYALADECQLLYERAGLALPEALRRFLSIDSLGSAAQVEEAALVIPAPRRSPNPPEFQRDWVWIPIGEASPQNKVLAALRQAKAPLRARDVVKAVQEIDPKISATSVANVGTRLHGKLIIREEGTWRLASPSLAGVVFDGMFWGPSEILNVYELAAHRRLGLLHLLKLNPDGLQAAQILSHLEGCTSSWMKAPVGKDLLKMDIEALSSSRRIKRKGNSKKWVLSEEAPM